MSHTPLRSSCVTLTVAAALVVGSIGTAAADPAADGRDLSSKSPVVIKVQGKPEGTKMMPGYTQLSSQMGSTELQNWYNSSPEWAQGILGIMFVAVALDAVGTLVGPVRSFVFNVIRDRHLPLPVPPRP